MPQLGGGEGEAVLLPHTGWRSRGGGRGVSTHLPLLTWYQLPWGGRTRPLLHAYPMPNDPNLGLWGRRGPMSHPGAFCQQRVLQLVLLLLVGAAAPGATRGRRLCRPVNATVAAEKEACPLCITFTTAICSGYCQTKEPVYKSALSPVAQHVCTYREVRYESLVLPACPPGIDPTFTYPVALSCHCSLCPMDSSDCTVQSIGPDFCSARRGYA